MNSDGCVNGMIHVSCTPSLNNQTPVVVNVTVVRDVPVFSQIHVNNFVASATIFKNSVQDILQILNTNICDDDDEDLHERNLDPEVETALQNKAHVFSFCCDRILIEHERSLWKHNPTWAAQLPCILDGESEITSTCVVSWPAESRYERIPGVMVRFTVTDYPVFSAARRLMDLNPAHIQGIFNKSNATMLGLLGKDVGCVYDDFPVEDTLPNRIVSAKILHVKEETRSTTALKRLVKGDRMLEFHKANQTYNLTPDVVRVIGSGKELHPQFFSAVVSILGVKKRWTID